jgi:hypothetical protein
VLEQAVAPVSARQSAAQRRAAVVEWEQKLAVAAFPPRAHEPARLQPLAVERVLSPQEKFSPLELKARQALLAAQHWPERGSGAPAFQFAA